MAMRMKAALIWMVALAVYGAPCECARRVAYSKRVVRALPMHVVTVDMNSPSVTITPAVARCGTGSCESFRSMMRRLRPAAAINGAFFCTRTLRPTGDIVIDGVLVAKGCVGRALAFTPQNRVVFVSSRQPLSYRWYDFERVLVAGPTLISGGRVAVCPRSEGFVSPVHFVPRIRAAVGLTGSNKLILLTTTRPTRLGRLAEAMRTMGCLEAATLDGGSSTGLYWQGKLIDNAGRAVASCLAVYETLDDYALHRNGFYPR